LGNPGLNPAEESWWFTTQGLVFFEFIYLEKMLETCAYITFPDFQRQTELFYKNVPESIYIGCMGTILNRVT